MRYVIIINLDYASQPEDSCRELWREIRERMQKVGFRCDGRLFTMDTTEEEATTLARKVIDDIDRRLAYANKSVYRYLKDFYGFDLGSTTNLLLPPTESYRVE